MNLRERIAGVVHEAMTQTMAAHAHKEPDTHEGWENPEAWNPYEALDEKGKGWPRAFADAIIDLLEEQECSCQQ